VIKLEVLVPGQWFHSVDDDSVVTDRSPCGGILLDEFFISGADIVGFESVENVSPVEDQWEDVVENSSPDT